MLTCRANGEKHLRIPEATCMNTGMWRLPTAFKGSVCVHGLYEEQQKQSVSAGAGALAEVGKRLGNWQ